MTLNTFSPSANPFNLGIPAPALPKSAHITVVGAGAFGGWTALYLLRGGYRVTLIDSWGPGNSRSSSGDETRVIRSTYGSNELYFDLNVRALSLWKENQQRWNTKLFYNSGVLWMCYEEKTPIVDDSIPFSRKHRMEYEYLSLTDLGQRFPLINTEDLHHGWFDPHGGYLKARESCQAVVDAFIHEGGKFLIDQVAPGKISSLRMEQIHLASGTSLTSDLFIFACGAWMGSLFPSILTDIITCSRQEAFYFGVPQDCTSAFNALPVWVDVDGKDFYYGIPGNANRGFKIGVDRRGENFDPTHGERISNREVFQHAKNFIEHRFPKLQNAPVLESRVCPYENSPDGNFIFDMHPEAKNLWLLGGGSGHGFKHGPALGELVANCFIEGKSVPSLWRIPGKN